jgi:hypothetical protein
MGDVAKRGCGEMLNMLSVADQIPCFSCCIAKSKALKADETEETGERIARGEDG